MDSALLDFICFGIGRLDLLASVELSRDPCLFSYRGGMTAGPEFPGLEAVLLASLPFKGQRHLAHIFYGPLHFPNHSQAKR